MSDFSAGQILIIVAFGFCMFWAGHNEKERNEKERNEREEEWRYELAYFTDEDIPTPTGVHSWVRKTLLGGKNEKNN